MDFTDDPFKDYRYEDPFNIEDPFADVADSERTNPHARPTSVAGFETDDFFSPASAINGNFALPEKRSGRVSAPPVAYDPFAGRFEFEAGPGRAAHNNNDAWAAWPAWPDDNRAAPAARPAPPARPAPDNRPDESDNWAADWGAASLGKSANETRPSNTLPSKKEKSPRPVKYARSLVHTIGGIGRAKQKEKKKANAEALASEEQQWAWASAESRRLQAEAEAARRREQAELQLALALSRRDQ